MQFLNVPDWDGKPYVVGDVFALTKSNRTSRCTLQTHPLQFELRLTVGRELLQSQVCRSRDEVLTTFERLEDGNAGQRLALILMAESWARANHRVHVGNRCRRRTVRGENRLLIAISMARQTSVTT